MTTVEVAAFRCLDKWDKHFLAWAARTADLSKDPDKKVGALIVSPDKRYVSYGYNGFPSGIEDDDLRLKHKTIKNDLTVHAELNAIINSRCDLKNWTMYCTSPPCAECSKAICQSGVKRLVCPKVNNESSWVASQSRGVDMMQKCGIEILWVTGYDYL